MAVPKTKKASRKRLEWTQISLHRELHEKYKKLAESFGRLENRQCSMHELLVMGYDFVETEVKRRRRLIREATKP